MLVIGSDAIHLLFEEPDERDQLTPEELADALRAAAEGLENGTLKPVPDSSVPGDPTAGYPYWDNKSKSWRVDRPYL